MADAAAGEMRGPAMVDWLDRLDAEIENIGAALEWALETDPEAAMRMAVGLLEYWIARVPSPENEARIVASVDAGPRGSSPVRRSRPGSSGSSRSGCSGSAARKWSLSGGADVGIGWAEQAVPLAAGATASPRRSSTRCRADDGADLHRGSRRHHSMARGGDPPAHGESATGSRSRSRRPASRSASASSIPSRSRSLRRSGRGGPSERQPAVIALTAMGQGNMLARSGRFDEARGRLQEAIDRFGESVTSVSRTRAGARSPTSLRRAGQLDEAMAIYRVSIQRWVRTGQPGAVAHQFENIAFA